METTPIISRILVENDIKVPYTVEYLTSHHASTVSVGPYVWYLIPDDVFRDAPYLKDMNLKDMKIIVGCTAPRSDLTSWHADTTLGEMVSDLQIIGSVYSSTSPESAIVHIDRKYNDGDMLFKSEKANIDWIFG